MTDVRGTVEVLISDRSDLRDDLTALIDLDEKTDTWTFDETELDSGDFGELVSRGVVESVGDEYRLADRDAVKAALTGDMGENNNQGDSYTSPGLLDVLTPHVDVRILGSIAALLVLVVAMRTVFSWGAVFRGGDIVLLGNDPYFYRYWLEELFRTNASIGSLPAPLQTHDVAMISVLHVLAAALGGDRQAVGLVLAWYPLVAAVVVGVFVYLAGVLAFDDRRVGLAGLAFYAITPIIAYRSAFGYGDHHAFDYALVAFTVVGLLCVTSARTDWRTTTPRRVAGALALAVGVAVQVHAWRGGALLLLPIAGAVVALVASDVRADRSPLASNSWLLGALATASVLAALPYLSVGWSGQYRAASPALLFGGSAATVLAGELAYRRGYSSRGVLAGELTAGAAAAGVAWLALPAVQDAVDRGLAYFTRTGQTTIVETYSLLSPEFGVIATPFYYFGPTFYLAFAGLLAVTYRVATDDQPRQLVLAAYTWVLFAGAVVQLRFAGQLAIPLAAFGGLAFVALVAAVDAAEPIGLLSDGDETSERRLGDSREADAWTPALPDRQTAFAVGSLFLLVGGFGLVLTPGGMSGLTIEESTYDTAATIDDHAAALNATWPENYVFSDWDRNRIYNYFINGQSQSYAYAQDYYTEFLASKDPSEWYERLSERPSKYVVVKPLDDNVPAASMQARLWNNWGSANGSVNGLSHYRAVYANDERKAFELVPGAKLVGAAPGNESVTVTTDVSVSGGDFTYERETTTSAGGAVTVTVPYDGEYAVGEQAVAVSNEAVRNGRYVVDDRLKRPGDSGELARWTFDEQLDSVVVDRAGDAHARVRGGPTYTEGVSGSAIRFDGDDDELRVPANQAPEIGDGSFTLAFWLQGNLSEASTTYPGIVTAPGNGSYGVWARKGDGVGDFGVRLDDTDGDSVRNFGIETTSFLSWTHVAVVLDRTDQELRLYRNGTLAETTSTDSLGTVSNDGPLFVGGRGGADFAPVELDRVRMFERALNETAIAGQATRSE